MLLRDKDRQALMEIFSSIDTPIEVWAHGSRVNGTAHEGSDLDLVVRTPHLKRLALEVLIEMKEKIQFSNIPIVVELYDWARLPESFHRNIESSHEVLFSNLEIIANEPREEYKQNPDKT